MRGQRAHIPASHAPRAEFFRVLRCPSRVIDYSNVHRRTTSAASGAKCGERAGSNLRPASGLKVVAVDGKHAKAAALQPHSVPQGRAVAKPREKTSVKSSVT